MSYEETLVCDECRHEICSGSREATTARLIAIGGRAYEPRRRGTVLVDVTRLLLTSQADGSRRLPRRAARHLCGSCVRRGAAAVYEGARP